MKNKQVWLSALALLLLLSGLTYYYLKDEPPKQPEAVETGAPQKIGLSFSGNTITEEKNGRKVFELSAETIEMNPDTKDIILKTLTAVFYSEDGKTVTLTGLEGLLNGQSHSLTIQGEVTAQSSDGATLQAGKIRYEPQEEKFYGENGVIVERPDARLTGDRLESDKDLTQLKVAGRAHIVKKE